MIVEILNSKIHIKIKDIKNNKNNKDIEGEK